VFEPRTGCILDILSCRKPLKGGCFNLERLPSRQDGTKELLAVVELEDGRPVERNDNRRKR